MNKISAEKCRAQFEAWWEGFYETTPRELWAELYSPEHDYYVDSDIDGLYDAWKASRQALEIALPVLEQQEKANDGWIEWNGGECPVGDCELVVAKLRDGTVLTALSAGNLAWWHNEPGFCNGRDIIAYRVVGQQERGEWIEWGGGKCPVSDGLCVEVTVRNSTKKSGIARDFMWYQAGDCWDIIAYRIIPEWATNQNGEQ